MDWASIELTKDGALNRTFEVLKCVFIISLQCKESLHPQSHL